MTRAAARLRHPSLSGTERVGEVALSPVSFSEAYADARDAYEQLEHALETHEPLAATAAAVDWWLAIERLREAS